MVYESSSSMYTRLDDEAKVIDGGLGIINKGDYAL
jgi:hypothetical protein